MFIVNCFFIHLIGITSNKTNMKKLFIFAVILSTSSIFAQSTAAFSFKLYFEDEVGNKDTLTLGYDVMATEGVDVAFGEENIIAQSWSPLFEARITNEYWINSNFPGTPEAIHLKKQIFNKNNIANRPMAIDIKSTNWPLKVSWDSTLFSPTEISGSFLTSIQYGTWFDLSRPDFLTEKNTVYYDTSSLVDLDHQIASYYTNNQDKIYTIWFGFSDSTMLTLSSENLMNEALKLYPNPFNNEFVITNLSTDQAVIIFDELGRKVKFEREGDKISLVNAKSGIYFVELVGNNRVFKILKD